MFFNLTAFFFQGIGQWSVAVVGNSYAFYAFSAVVEAAHKNAKEIRLLANHQCLPFFDAWEGAPSLPLQEQCSIYFDTTVALLNEMKPDIIILIFR